VCEFEVFLDGTKVFEDAVYAKSSGETTIVKNILGETRELEQCQIIEVDVQTTKLVLTSTSS
jgi:predicted RNA-binding protein